MQPMKSLAVLALMFLLTPVGAQAQQSTREEVVDGRRYRVTTRTIQKQVPVTEMRDHQQTTYRQQLTTQSLTHQQLYCVPVTQYKMVSKLKGRWNPLITPYWTHEMRPVTTWQQQVGTVQIPMTQTAWVPETRTVQTPVTTFKTAEQTTETRVALGNAPSGRALASTGPSATLAARPSAGITRSIGGTALQNDPPRRNTEVGWRPPSESRH
ncbi:hypothetical protein OAS39_02530 [Pirellulales bacterium]|nr:hypothetical protein [Pirellulales bacterium]